jgi:hypothetical protein
MLSLIKFNEFAQKKYGNWKRLDNENNNCQLGSFLIEYAKEGTFYKI